VPVREQAALADPAARPAPVIRVEARAKVNLHLHVTGRRPDGYHELDSLVVFAAVGDTVEARHADGLSLEIDGPFAGPLAAEADNLVLRAAGALARSQPGAARGAALRLTKRLPLASGIGGGSADAAATLRALDLLWGLGTPEPELGRIGLSLGADVPVCLRGRPVRMQGIGEILEPAPALPAFGLVLVNPGVAVPTQAVFRARSPGFREAAALPPGWGDAAGLAAVLERCSNDLAEAAIGLAPGIDVVLAALRADPGVLLARMSGSGATCFGITSSPEEAAAAAARLARPSWWVWGGGTSAGA